MTCFWLALQHWSAAPCFCAGQSRAPLSGSEHRRNLESDLQSMHAELDELSVMWDAARQPQRRAVRPLQASVWNCYGRMYQSVWGAACQPRGSPTSHHGEPGAVGHDLIHDYETLSSIPVLVKVSKAHMCFESRLAQPVAVVLLLTAGQQGDAVLHWLQLRHGAGLIKALTAYSLQDNRAGDWARLPRLILQAFQVLSAQLLQDTQAAEAAAQTQKSPTVSNSTGQAQEQQALTPAQLRLSFSPSGVPGMQPRRPGIGSSSWREQGLTSASLAAAAAQEAVPEAPQLRPQQEATPGSLTFKVADNRGSSSKRSTPGFMPTPLPQRGRDGSSTLGVAQPSIDGGRPTSASEQPDLARVASLGEQMSDSEAHRHPQNAAQAQACTPGGCSDLTTPGTGDCCFGSRSSRGLDSSRRPGSRGSATNRPGTNLCKNPAFDAGEQVSSSCVEHFHPVVWGPHFGPVFCLGLQKMREVSLAPFAGLRHFALSCAVPTTLPFKLL